MTDRRPKGRKSLKPDDERLWRYVTRSIKPLEGRSKPNRPAVLPNPAPDFSAKSAGAPGNKKSLTASSSRPIQKKPAPVSPSPLDGPPNAQWARRMRRGDVAIDARLDLHGLTQAEAHSRLLRFVSMAVAQQLRVLLVITGKGSRSGSGSREETGVLRRNLPHWLKQSGISANILAITPAHPRHGGSGAYYVALRRARDVRD